MTIEAINPTTGERIKAYEEMSIGDAHQAVNAADTDRVKLSLSRSGDDQDRRSVDGSYSGTYRGHGFMVRRELVRRTGRGKHGGDEKVWVARCGTLVVKAPWYANSRAHAVRELQRELDRATVKTAP